MVIKVYVSGISPNKEVSRFFTCLGVSPLTSQPLIVSQVKTRQQRALLILDAIQADYKVIDITEPENEEARDFFKENCKKRDPEPLPLPPQFFNEDKYCGDWEDFFAASDEDTLYAFLGLEAPKGEQIEVVTNGHVEEQKESDFNAQTAQETSESPPKDEGIVIDEQQPSSDKEVGVINVEHGDEEEEIEVVAEQEPETESPQPVEENPIASEEKEEEDVAEEEKVEEDTPEEDEETEE